MQDNRITTVPYDPSVGVVTAWDLGIGDSTAYLVCTICRPRDQGDRLL